MASFDPRDFEFDGSGDLSTAMGTEALVGNDVVARSRQVYIEWMEATGLTLST
jgi:hypothetical protein